MWRIMWWLPDRYTVVDIGLILVCLANSAQHLGRLIALGIFNRLVLLQ